MTREGLLNDSHLDTLLLLIIFSMMQAVSNYLKGAAVGAEIHLEFENKSVELGIPSKGIVETGWAIKPLTPPVVRLHDNFLSFLYIYVYIFIIIFLMLPKTHYHY